jgi:hypothetical protein
MTDWDDCSCEDCVECGGGGSQGDSAPDITGTTIAPLFSANSGAAVDTVVVPVCVIDAVDPLRVPCASNRVVVPGCQMCVDFLCCPDHCCGIVFLSV